MINKSYSALLVENHQLQIPQIRHSLNISYSLEWFF